MCADPDPPAVRGPYRSVAGVPSIPGRVHQAGRFRLPATAPGVDDDTVSNPLAGDGAPAKDHDHHRATGGGWARAAVFGASDGLVTNVSLVIGFAGSGAGPDVVRLAGIAGLVAGAVSMAAGEYNSVLAHNELIARELDVERRELARNAEGETAELAARFEKLGVPAHRARAVAEDVMADPESALLVHAREELGIDPDSLASPWEAAGSSFLAFSLGATAPIVPWFVTSGLAATIASLVIGVVAAVVLGVVLTRLSERRGWAIVRRQVIIVAIGCAISWVVGQLVG
jgi:VIT1/CCC1 family predicted Fe2+/Mn2+ transporter